MSAGGDGGDEQAVPAILFDGRSARRHEIAIGRDAGDLLIVHETGAIERIALAALERQGSGPWGDRLVRPDQPGWRLDIPGGLPTALAAALPAPHRYGRWIDRMGLGRAAVAFAAISAALVGVVLTAPQWLGPLVPLPLERRIGEALVGDLASATCHTPAGDAALAKLMASVDLPGQAPVRAQVLKVGMINAAALPGNRVVLFSGLFDEMKDPDAVAGVVAHELGHARKRHVMQALLRELGLSVVLAGTSGTVPVQLAKVTGLRYSREAEAEADAFARDRLAAAAISPAATGAFFAKAAKEEPAGPWMVMLASHPASADRAKAFGGAVDRSRRYRSALSPAEWQALSRMCDEDKRVKPLLDF